ncbi:hypothetical protein ACIPSA_49805 [Streptomyces sp. NPDC086549]|uniref:hypothetical protein n=1 Tax=Streptomyces sp. NPDC086549 TaxID=3365752 RepID=UPI0037F31212
MKHGIASRVMSSLLGPDSRASAPVRRWQGYSLAYRVAASFFNQPLKPIGAAPLRARAKRGRPAALSLVDAADQWLLLPATERLARRSQIHSLLLSVETLANEAAHYQPSRSRTETAKVLALGNVAATRLPRAICPDMTQEEAEIQVRTIVRKALDEARKTTLPIHVPGPMPGVVGAGEVLLLRQAEAIALDLKRTLATLKDAKDSFLAADLRAAAHVEQAEFVGVRWDAQTQWPDDEWEARMRRASRELPPGSGIFVVVGEPLHRSDPLLR